jgi:hypothetical protein
MKEDVEQEAQNCCYNIKLLFDLLAESYMNREEYDEKNSSNQSAAGDNDNNSINDENESAADDTASKDIKKAMARYQDKIGSAGEEPPVGDSTRSEE